MGNFYSRCRSHNKGRNILDKDSVRARLTNVITNNLKHLNKKLKITDKNRKQRGQDYIL